PGTAAAEADRYRSADEIRQFGGERQHGRRVRADIGTHGGYRLVGFSGDSVGAGLRACAGSRRRRLSANLTHDKNCSATLAVLVRRYSAGQTDCDLPAETSGGRAMQQDMQMNS
ncbi:MAG TPA: hypothetical protein PLP91_12755, partial [Plasticicumulans sp.]|nr:hypothetical protein [Plasticicumulans sp.]